MNASPPVEVVLRRLAERGVSVPAGVARVDSFGDSPELSAELLALIRCGRKRAGTSLLWALEAEGEALPAPDEIALVVDHWGEPALICRITDVQVLPFAAVAADYAALEGEGDGSLKYWREVHWAFFCREGERLGRHPAQDMPVVCTTFDLLTVVP